ncbi:MAG: O-methyltransferase [Steroidobacteraceae bacterium]
MTTLTNAPCADVLARLFAEADASDARLDAWTNALPTSERAELMAGTGNFRQFYGQLKDYHLAVSRSTASLLYILARSCRAKTIIEFGTSFGVSTLHLAAALRDNGGGRLIGTEFEATKAAQARENVTAAGLGGLVEIREGDALQTLASDLPELVDLVLLDGAKPLYLSILSMLEARLHAGSLVVADNADRTPEYLARVRDSASGFLSVPFAGDVELSMRL